MTEAGWYHVDGDPPGTVRRWNGSEWIGFPVPDPDGPGTSAGQGHARSRLSQQGALLSAMTMATLTALCVIFAVLAGQLLSDASRITQAERSSAAVRLSDVGDYVDNLDALVLAALVGIAITAVVFIMWLRAAATAARVKNLKRSAASVKRSTFSIVVQILIFGLLAPLWWGVRAALASVSAGSPNLFVLVSDTAMASSIDPHTGISKIEPLKIVAWWALWWAPVFVGVVSWGWVWMTGPTAERLQTVTQLTGALLIAEVLSLVFIIATVGQITRHLTR